MKRSALKYRILTLLLTLTLLCGIAVLPIAAEGVAAIVSSDTAFVGATVTLTVTLSSSIAAKSGAVTVSYDETALSLVSAGWSVTNTVLSTFDPSQKVGAFAYQSATTIQGAVFSATFQVLEAAKAGATSVSMNIRLKDQANADLTITNTPGTVTIMPKVEGTVATVNGASALPGQTVTFMTRLSSSVRAKSGAVSLLYDKTVLKLESGSWNVTGALLTHFDPSKEVGAFAYQSSTTVSDVVFTATFTVLEDAPVGESVVGLTLRFTDDTGADIPITNMNGKIMVTDTGGLRADVNDVSAGAGETVIFTATLSEAVSVKSGAVSLSYDKTVLQLVSGAWNVSNTILNRFDPTNEVGAFAYSSLTEISGTIFTATFRVLDSAAVGTTAVGLSIQLKDASNAAITIQNKQGNMTVKPAECISASIVWTSMSFTYTDGEWNPAEHDYETGIWSSDAENGGQITVTNEGNVAITSSFMYTPTATEISGTFTKTQAKLLVGASDTVSMILSGRPAQPMSGEKIGTVTVTIIKSAQ